MTQDETFWMSLSAGTCEINVPGIIGSAKPLIRTSIDTGQDRYHKWAGHHCESAGSEVTVAMRQPMAHESHRYPPPSSLCSLRSSIFTLAFRLRENLLVCLLVVYRYAWGGSARSTIPPFPTPPPYTAPAILLIRSLAGFPAAFLLPPISLQRHHHRHRDTHRLEPTDESSARTRRRSQVSRAVSSNSVYRFIRGLPRWDNGNSNEPEHDFILLGGGGVDRSNLLASWITPVILMQSCYYAKFILYIFIPGGLARFNRPAETDRRPIDSSLCICRFVPKINVGRVYFSTRPQRDSNPSVTRRTS